MVLEYSIARILYIARAVIEIAIILLVRILVNNVEKLMILPRCILPLISETIIHIRASPRKNGKCDGRYDLRLAGFVHTSARNDIVRMTISARSVIVLNLRFSFG
jgi:hypothetical protein